MRFHVWHKDHGVTASQLAYVCEYIEKGVLKPGPFILRIGLPPALGTAPCALHGPVMGDPPVEDEDVVFWTRGERGYADRCVDRPLRPVDILVVIGQLDESGFCLLETLFGGPLAPMNPADQKCQDVAASKEFWSTHALSIPAEKDR